MAGLEKTRMCTALSSALVHVQKGETEQAGEALKTLIAESDGAQNLSLALKKGELAHACFATNLEGEGAQVVLDIMRNAPDERTVAATKDMLKDAGKADLGEALAEADQCRVRDLVAEGARKAQEGDLDGAVQFMLTAVRKMPGNTNVLFATLALLKHIEGCGWNERYAEQARNMMERARPGPGQRPPAGTYHLLLQPLKRWGSEP